MKAKVSGLAAFMIFCIGLAIPCCLLGAIVNEYISPRAYIIGTGVTAVVMYFDSCWINKHFVDGEWV